MWVSHNFSDDSWIATIRYCCAENVLCMGKMQYYFAELADGNMQHPMRKPLARYDGSLKQQRGSKHTPW